MHGIAHSMDKFILTYCDVCFRFVSMNCIFKRYVSAIGCLMMFFGGFFVQVKAQLINTKAYIDTFKSIAMQEMRSSGVPASITLGQGVLESSSGNSKLAKNCNNHFGIKCRSNWTGKFCLADDDAKDECFRGYETAFDSYRDHSLFLKGSKRYFPLFELSVTDYKGWANGLKEAGYATNPSYANILIGVIEKYRLSRYDSMVILGKDFYDFELEKSGAPVVLAGENNHQSISEINGIQAVVARPGETPEDIAARYNMGIWQIYKYNDISKGQALNPGEIIYLKPKRRKATEESHLVKPGETMREISQKYGVKVKHLYKLNRLDMGDEVQAGEVVFLQDKRPIAPSVRSNVDEREPKLQSPLKLEESASVGTGSPQVDYRSFMSNEESVGVLGPKTHIVLRGETLYSISRMYGLSLDSLVKWNHLDGNALNVDRKLFLENVAASRQASGAQYDAFHFVQPGETLYAISKKYNVGVEIIKQWNNLQSNQIEVGQRLKVR